MNILINTFEDWQQATQIILKEFPEKTIFLIEASMGMGKTTFVQSFGKILNVKEHITSPTFSIVHEYHTDKLKIAHFDLYRINNVEELKNIGFEEYLDNSDFCFIEWPLLCQDLITEHLEWKNKMLLLHITLNKDGTRNMLIQEKN